MFIYNYLIMIHNNDYDCKIVIIGPENSGKSALINALFGKYISQVSNIGGTTKNPIKKYWGSIKYGKSKKNPKFAKIYFVDVGGLCTSENKNSPIMVGKKLKKTFEEIESSDIIIHVIDGEKGLLKNFEKLHHQLKFRYQKPIIVVINKSDLIDNDKKTELIKCIENRLNNRAIITSTITYEGINTLLNHIQSLINEVMESKGG